MSIQPLPVLDLQTQVRLTLPQLGEENWMTWLFDQGYLIEDRVDLTEDDPNSEIELYFNPEANVWTMYHPLHQGQTETECLYVNIPIEEQARNLVELALNLTQAVDLAVIGVQAVQSQAQSKGNTHACICGTATTLPTGSRAKYRVKPIANHRSQASFSTGVKLKTTKAASTAISSRLAMLKCPS